MLELLSSGSCLRRVRRASLTVVHLGEIVPGLGGGGTEPSGILELLDRFGIPAELSQGDATLEEGVDVVRIVRSGSIQRGQGRRVLARQVLDVGECLQAFNRSRQLSAARHKR